MQHRWKPSIMRQTLACALAACAIGLSAPANARPFCTDPPFLPLLPLAGTSGSRVFEQSYDIDSGGPACFKLDVPGARTLHITLATARQSGFFRLYPQGWNIQRTGDAFTFGVPGVRGAADGDNARSWTGQLPEGNSLLVIAMRNGGRQYRLHVEVY
jgi:hypothetical protein